MNIYSLKKIATKDRDPKDCVSDKPKKNYIYAINNLKRLPPIEVSWILEEYKGHDRKQQFERTS